MNVFQKIRFPVLALSLLVGGHGIYKVKQEDKARVASQQQADDLDHLILTHSGKPDDTSRLEERRAAHQKEADRHHKKSLGGFAESLAGQTAATGTILTTLLNRKKRTTPKASSQSIS